MANDVYMLVGDCRKCALNGPADKLWRPLQLFLAKDPVELVAMDILGPLPGTWNGNQFVLVIMDQFSKLVRVVPTPKMTALSMGSLFMDKEGILYAYGVSQYVLTDIVTQFSCKLFESLWIFWRIKHVVTTAYTSETIGQE